MATGTIRLADRQEACLDLIEGRVVLDVGCYEGGFVRRIRQRYPEKTILGVDYFEENIRRARELNPDMAENFRCLSVYDLALPPASVDCVTFQAAIEHLEQAALAVKQINRVLRPGGYLVLTTDNPYGWRYLLAFLRDETRNTWRRLRGRPTELKPVIFNPAVEYARHIHAWTPRTLLTLMAVNGFEYVWHGYVPADDSLAGRMAARLAPAFFGLVQVLKVRKVAEAPVRFV